jgi:hypothetical protein
MRSLLLRCYPARWRDRYGDEFAELLEERPLGPFDVADILLGALDAQLRLRGRGAASQKWGLSMSLRMGGIAAIIGGALWAPGAVVVSSSTEDGHPIGWLLVVGGSVALLVALAGLSAFMARQHPVLAWAAFAIPALGTIAFVVGVLGEALHETSTVAGLPSESLLLLAMLGFAGTFLGSGLFAIATYGAAILSRAAAFVLAVGSILSFLGAFGQLPFVVLVAAFVTFGLGWFALGVEAIRLDRPATELRPA